MRKGVRLQFGIVVLIAALNIFNAKGDNSINDRNEYVEAAIDKLNADSPHLDFTFGLTNQIEVLQAKFKEQGKISPDQIGRDDVKIFIGALAKLKSGIDPNFDPKKVPRLSLAPPSGQYFAGVSPDSVSDPIERQKYIAAIAENNEYSKIYSREIKKINKFNNINRFYAQYLKKKISDQGILDQKEIIELLSTDPNGADLAAAFTAQVEKGNLP